MRRSIALFIALGFILCAAVAMGTVGSPTARIQYQGNGTNTTFAYPFYVIEADDITVILTDGNGVETVQTLNTDYSVTGAGNESGGNVIFASAPSGTETVTIVRDVEITQETDYVANDPFPAATHEAALDKLTMIAQQHKEALDRTIKLPRSASSSVNTELPPPEAMKVIGWDSGGQNLTSYGISAITVESAQIDYIGNYNTLADAISTIGSTKKTLQINAVVPSADDALIPDNITLWFTDTGGIQPAATKTVTIERPSQIKAGAHKQIFGGSGTVAFSNPGVVHIGWFGAKSDGTTEDTAAIQAAVDSLPSDKPGSVVLFPAGATYTDKIEPDSNMTLKGFGMDQSTIKRKLAGAGTAQNLIDIDGKSRVTVRDLTIDGNSTDFISQFHHLIGVTNSSYVTVENVRLYRMTSDGVFVSYEDGPSEHIRICNNEFENTAYCMRNGISIVRANDVAIIGNVFRHVSQNTMPGAIDVEPLSGEPTHDCSDILIEGNRFYDTATNDIQVSAGEMDIRNVVIRNNYHKNSGADGASNAKGAVYCHIRSPYTGELSDVFIDGNYFDGVRDSAVFVTNGKRVAVHNNYITNQYMQGIYLGSSYSTGVFDVSVRGNTIWKSDPTNAYNNGIVLGVVTRVLVDSNIIADQQGSGVMLYDDGATGFTQTDVWFTNNLIGNTSSGETPMDEGVKRIGTTNTTGVIFQRSNQIINTAAPFDGNLRYENMGANESLEEDSGAVSVDPKNGEYVCITLDEDTTVTIVNAGAKVYDGQEILFTLRNTDASDHTVSFAGGVKADSLTVKADQNITSFVLKFSERWNWWVLMGLYQSDVVS